MKFKVYCIQQENFANNFITFFYNLNPPKPPPSAIKINYKKQKEKSFESTYEMIDEVRKKITQTHGWPERRQPLR